MLTKDQNELLTRVGPDTPMNALFKRYWLPALLSTDLPTPDCDPKRLTLLGETYVAFRDSSGKVGFLEEGCCHRGVSLALGRVEEGGIRCIFHGWKFAVDGTLLDTPNVPDPIFKTRFKAPAFPVEEAGDVIWVYLGPRDKQPPFRRLEYMDLPSSHRMVVRLNHDCNYLQVLEGGIDSSHVGILHSDYAKSAEVSAQALPKGMQHRQVFSTDYAPRLDLRLTEFGFHYGALRKLDDGNFRVRITPFLMPNLALIPPNLFIQMYVPYDDTTMGQFVTYWDKHRPVVRERALKVLGLDQPGVWVNDHMEQNAGNNWQQNRARMPEGSFSGLVGLAQEDSAVNLSQGIVLDRTKEHLVQADVAVATVRRLLLDAVEAVARGEDPIGLRPSNTRTIQALEETIGPEVPWQTVVPGNIE